MERNKKRMSAKLKICYAEIFDLSERLYAKLNTLHMTLQGTKQKPAS